MYKLRIENPALLLDIALETGLLESNVSVILVKYEMGSSFSNREDKRVQRINYLFYIRVKLDRQMEFRRISKNFEELRRIAVVGRTPNRAKETIGRESKNTLNPEKSFIPSFPSTPHPRRDSL